MHGGGASFSRGEGKAGVVNTASLVDRPSGRRAGVRGDCWSPLVVAPACAVTIGLSWSSRRHARQPLVFLWSSRRRARRSLVCFLWLLHLSSRHAGMVSVPMSSTTSHVFHHLPHIILHPHVILSSGTSSPTCHLLPTSTSTIRLGAAGNCL